MAKRNSNFVKSEKVSLKLSYNPYTYESILEGIDISENSRLNEYLYQNNQKQLQLWYKNFFNIIEEEYNTKSILLSFKGREEDYIDISDEVLLLNGMGWNIDLSYEKVTSTNENIFESLNKFVRDLKESAPDELRKKLEEKKAFEEFENSKNSEAYVSVIATMSSGKSTLINSILEEELLPSKNEACTATISRIKDIDNMEDFRVRVEDLEGNEVHTWQNATNEFLTEVNEKGNEKGLNIVLEGDIPGISSQEMNLVIIDTPGPNNSQNAEHKAATYRYIKDNESNPLVLYVMNATQHATNDDNKLLTEIADIIKEKGKQAEERFLFALNKIDCFDIEKENVEKLIENNKKYLRDKGIENPKIFPISAEFAKLKKLSLKDRTLSRTEKNNLNNFQYNFMPDLEEGYEGIDTIKYASISKRLKDELYEESKGNLDKAHLHYSGITAIERYVDNYVSKYAKTQKIKDSITTMKQILDASYHEIKSLHGKTAIELDQTINQINSIENEIKTSGKEKIDIVKNNILKLKINEDKFNNLMSKVGKVFDNLEDDFNDTSASENKAREIIKDAVKILDTLMVELETSVESIINDEVRDKTEKIVEEIKLYFSSLLKDVKIDKNLNKTIKSSFEIEIPRTNSLINKGSYTKSVYAGQEYVKTERYGFLWLKKRDIYKDVYRDEERVDLNKIFNSEILPMNTSYREPIAEKQKFLISEIDGIKKQGLKNIEMVEDIAMKKLLELKNKAQEAKNLESKSKMLEVEISKIVSFKEELDLILGL